MEKFKKDKLRMYAFLTACFIVLVLLNSIGVFAYESFNLITRFNISLDDILNNDDFVNSNEYVVGLSPFYPKSSTQYSTVSDGISNNLFQFDFESTGYDDSYLSMNNFFMNSYGQSANATRDLVRFAPDGSFVSFENNQYFLYYVKDSVDTIGTSIPNYSFVNGVFANKGSWGFSSSYFSTIDNVNYYKESIGSNQRAIVTNMPIYYNNGSAITTLEGVSNLNYSPISSSSGSGQTASNNLDLPDGDWTFKNTSFTAPYNVSFNTGSVYPSGNITFSYTPSDYQVEHASDFTLTFGFTFDYDVNYKNWGGSDVGPFLQTDSLLNNQKNYSAHWYYSDQGVEYIDVPLSDFISSGNSKSYTFYDILKNMGGGTYSYETVLLNSKELEYVSYNKFNITCTAFISSSNESSGNITEWYNPMNKKGYTTDESGKVNKNPYSDDSSSDVTPSGGGAPGTAGSSGDNSNNIGGGSGNSSATASNGSIVINNTNNNTANGGSGSGGSGSGGGGSEVSESAVTFYTTFNPFKLIFNKLIGDNETISDETADTIGSNSFITLLSSTFTFIPSGVLTYLTWFFGACLSILIVAIVLRVLLDLL